MPDDKFNSLKHILLFDDECILCNRLVLFVIRMDKDEKFRFAALRSESGQRLLFSNHLSVTDLNTVVYIQNGNCFTRSTAVIQLLTGLGGFWKVFRLFKYIPVQFRDFIYTLVAENRHRIFGKNKNCKIPSTNLNHRFLP
jgi:predicted DCC family thiol-disulfide oxidoreductase YuxK